MRAAGCRPFQTGNQRSVSRLRAKKGIVKDPKTHLKVIENVIAYANECHLSLQALSFSPITGGEGNIEFLAHFKVGGVNNPIDIENVVNEAHICFKG